MIFVIKIAILSSGPYIAFQYNFTKNEGHEFKARNNLADSVMSLLEKLLFIFSDILKRKFVLRL